MFKRLYFLSLRLSHSACPDFFVFSLHRLLSEKSPKIQAARPQQPGPQKGYSTVGEAQIFAREEQGQMERQVREDGGHSRQRAEERDHPQRRKIRHQAQAPPGAGDDARWIRRWRPARPVQQPQLQRRSSQATRRCLAVGAGQRGRGAPSPQQ